MIYLLHGDDEFTLSEFISSIKDEVEPVELRDVNIAVMDGAAISVDELTAVSSTIPFMSEKRVVIVRGLLSRFEGLGPRRARARDSNAAGRPLGAWEALADYLPQLPPTTVLVFADGKLKQSNPLFAAVRPHVQVKAFPLPTWRDLKPWIRERSSKYAVDIEQRAVDALADAVGSNLRVIDMELQKLALYRRGETIRDADVHQLVSYVREASVFAAVDAVLEGRTGLGIRLLHQLHESGRTTSYLIGMMARQLRLTLLTKELKGQGLNAEEIGRRLSLSGYPLQKTLEQEPKFTFPRLVAIHQRLLEADLSLKTRPLDEELTLDMLVAELASRA